MSKKKFVGTVVAVATAVSATATLTPLVASAHQNKYFECTNGTITQTILGQERDNWTDIGYKCSP